MKICHINLIGYSDEMEYHDNILPRKHKELGFDVYRIIHAHGLTVNGFMKIREYGEYTDRDNILNIVLEDGKPTPLLKFRTYIGLYENLVKLHPDIIFVHCCQFYNIKDIIRYKKTFPQVKLFVDNHTDYINTPVNSIKRKLFYYFVIGRFARSVAKYADKFWGVTPSRVDYLKKVYKIKSNNLDLLVMPGDNNKIHPEKREEYRNDFCKQFDIKYNDFIVVTGGKIDKRKNFHLLIEAFKGLPYNCKLLIFGTPDKEMKPYFNSLPFNVIYTGWVTAEQTYKYFVMADLGVFPGTHSVLWEQAVSSGLPCIFKYWEGMDHVNTNGNARMMDLDDEHEIVTFLKENIIRLSDKGQDFKKMDSIAKTRGMQLFSYPCLLYTSPSPRDA